MSFASNNHLQIFNPAPEATGTFPLFNRLPAELRWMVWEQALSHERLLQVKLYAPRVVKNRIARPHKPTANREYPIVLVGRQPISRLFRVNGESRHVALCFYRVQLPCYYRYRGKLEEYGTFYFNPEFDILRFNETEHSAKFAHDLWVHDRRGVGLVNIAMPRGRHYFGKHTKQEHMPLLRQVISRLERVIFTKIHDLSGPLFGPLGGGAPAVRNCKTHGSRPVMSSSILGFDRLSRDPRPIDTDINRVYMSLGDVRKLVDNWFSLLATLQVQHAHKVDYRIMVACESSQSICNRRGAARWFTNDDVAWKAALRRKWAKEHPSAFLVTPEELEGAPRPAIGFWLFPIEIIGPLSDPNWRENDGTADLSEYQPELCLSHLPVHDG